MPRRFRRKSTLPFRLPARWVVVTAAYLALALAFALLLAGPSVGRMLTSHARLTTVPPGTGTVSVAVTPAPMPAADEYIPVPAGPPAGPPSTPTTTSTDTSAGQP